MDIKHMDTICEFIDLNGSVSQDKTPKNLGGNSQVTTNDKMFDNSTEEEPITTDKYSKGLYRNYLIGVGKPATIHRQVTESNNIGVNGIEGMDKISHQVVKDKLDIFIESLYSIKDKPKEMAIILNYLVETFVPYINDLTAKTAIRNKIK